MRPVPEEGSKWTLKWERGVTQGDPRVFTVEAVPDCHSGQRVVVYSRRALGGEDREPLFVLPLDEFWQVFEPVAEPATELFYDVPVCTMRLPGGFIRAEARWRDLTASSTAVTPGEELSARGRANDDFEQVELVDAAGTVISFDRRYHNPATQPEPAADEDERNAKRIASEIASRLNARLAAIPTAEPIAREVSLSEIASICDAYCRGDLADKRVYLMLGGGWLMIPKDGWLMIPKDLDS